jgi:hypothetical protein
MSTENEKPTNGENTSEQSAPVGASSNEAGETAAAASAAAAATASADQSAATASPAAGEPSGEQPAAAAAAPAATVGSAPISHDSGVFVVGPGAVTGFEWRAKAAGELPRLTDLLAAVAAKK